MLKAFKSISSGDSYIFIHTINDSQFSRWEIFCSKFLAKLGIFEKKIEYFFVFLHLLAVRILASQKRFQLEHMVYMVSIVPKKNIIQWNADEDFIFIMGYINCI